MQVKTHVSWVKGMQFAGAGWSGHTVTMDAGEDFDGNDSAARPLELMLVSLCGCTGMDVVSLLRKMRVDFSGIELNVEAEKTEDHPHVFARIDIEYVITGDNVDEAKVKKAIELSQDRYCSVSAMLRKACPLTHTLTIRKP
jgi:putative redox protein